MLCLITADVHFVTEFLTPPGVVVMIVLLSSVGLRSASGGVFENATEALITSLLI